MLTEDDPLFANWDQDETAIEATYAEQDPAEVAVDLIEAAGARRRPLLDGDDRDLRAPGDPESNGSAFTVERSGRTTCTTWSTTSTTSAHEAHRVLGPARPRDRPGRSRTWSELFVLTELGNRTTVEALDAGVPPAGVVGSVARAGAARDRALILTDL